MKQGGEFTMALKDFKNTVTRSVASAAIDGVLKYIDKEEEKDLLNLVNLSEKLMGNKFKKSTFDAVRNLVKDDDSKWMKFADNILDDIDSNVIKMHLLNFGYQSAFYGYSKTCDFEKENDYKIPWINLRCIKKDNLLVRII